MNLSSLRCIILSLAVFTSCSGVISHVDAEGDALQNISFAVFVSSISNNTRSFVGGSDVGRPFVEAVELAVTQINNDSSLLPGYKLNTVITDAECQAGASVRGFIDQILTEPTKIMIIGADCSVSTEPIAELAPFWNLVQISPVSTSPSLSNTDTYTTFLRVVSSDVAVTDGIVSLMGTYNWSRLAVISQQESIFTSMLDKLRQAPRFTDGGELGEFTFTTNDNPSDVVDRLFNSPYRIIFLSVYPDYGLEIMCLAYKKGMTHVNGYQWLLFAWYSKQWWLADPTSRRYIPETCDQRMMEDMIEYSILIDHFSHVTTEQKSNPTNTSLNRLEFEELLQQRLVGANDTSLASQAQFYFDAVWTAALALHKTVVTDGYNLSSFTNELGDLLSSNISRTIYDNARSLEFTGTSGPIRFNEDGDRYPFLRYFQYMRNASQMIFRNQIGIGNDTVGATFPFGVPQDEEFIYIQLSIFVIYTILALMGVAFAIVCLIINIIFKNKKIVKLSSPYLNILIVCGVVLFYVDVILFGIDKGTPAPCSFVDALCMIRIWVASIAFSLVFGTIFVKTWRVYYVFYKSNRHKRSNKSLIQDWLLFLMVGVLVAGDVIFLTLVTAFPDSRLTLTNIELPSNSRELPRIVNGCLAEDRIIWLSVMFVYKGILLIIGICLAFETRKVNIRHLNDSKLIGMAVYGIVVLSVALSVIGLLLETHVNAFYEVIGGLIMLGNTSLLCLIFIPKFYGLWKDPDGLKIMGGNGTATANTDSKETIGQLNQEIQKLKQELSRLSISTNPLQEGALNSKNYSSSQKTITFSEDMIVDVDVASGRISFPPQDESASFHSENNNV